MPDAEGPGAFPESADQRYFRAVESALIELRGAPLLLSPAEWRLISEWRRRGIPLRLVLDTMTELDRRRRERGEEDPPQSLRYFARAVESAWRRARELEGPVRAGGASAPDPGPRLRELAQRLPDALPEVETWRRRIRDLSGAPAEVERELGRLESELLTSLREELPAAVLEAWRRRAPASAETPEAFARSIRGLLRRRFGVPALTLVRPGREGG